MEEFKVISNYIVLALVIGNVILNLIFKSKELKNIYYWLFNAAMIMYNSIDLIKHY